MPIWWTSHRVQRIEQAVHHVRPRSPGSQSRPFPRPNLGSSQPASQQGRTGIAKLHPLCVLSSGRSDANTGSFDVTCGVRLVVQPFIFFYFQQWDTELATVAATNARRCIYGHDECRSTVRYPYAGQNIGLFSYYALTFTVTELITDFIYDWYSEYTLTTPAFLAKYPRGYTG